jgi:uncharacterized surface protein with fasciclin (FAS1) repeats
MKRSLTCMAALAGTCIAGAALANNAMVEDALKSRPDLSVFYQALANTGVLSELREGQPYTVFAPTNAAFARITRDQYPCFYSSDCKAQVAEVLRRHIVPGEKHLSDMNPQGGIMSMFSIDGQHIVAGEPEKDKFAVDGQNVISENQLMGGDIYKIDGVMASNRVMAQFVAPRILVVHASGTDLPPATPAGKIVTVTTTDATTPIPY